MLGEIGGPCNYENMVKCFETKMSGFVNDPDDLVVGAFKSYNEECKFAFVFRNTMSLGVIFFRLHYYLKENRHRAGPGTDLLREP